MNDQYVPFKHWRRQKGYFRQFYKPDAFFFAVDFLFLFSLLNGDLGMHSGEY